MYLLTFFIADNWLESFQTLKCHNDENKNIRKVEEDQFKARMSGCHGTMTGLKAVGQTGSRNELLGHRIPTYRDFCFYIFLLIYAVTSCPVRRESRFVPTRPKNSRDCPVSSNAHTWFEVTCLKLSISSKTILGYLKFSF